MNYWIGQGFGIIATVVGLLIPLFRKKWQMLIANFSNNLLLALNLVFLDEVGSGIFLFVVAMVQAAVNFVHCLRSKAAKPCENALFLCLYLGLGFYGLFTAPGFVPAVNGKNLLELLPILGAVCSMLFISEQNANRSRWYYMACSFVWFVYYIIIGSTSLLGSLLSLITGTAAIIRSKKEKRAAGVVYEKVSSDS